MDEKRILANCFGDYQLGTFYVESCFQKWKEENEGAETWEQNNGCEGSSSVKIIDYPFEFVENTNDGIKKEIKILPSMIKLGVMGAAAGKFENYFRGEGKFQCPHCKKKLRHAEIIQKETGKIDLATGVKRTADFCETTGEWWS